MAPVAILVPALARPQNVAPLVRAIRQTTPRPYSILFVCDPDDTEQIAAVHREAAGLLLCGGSYAKKINEAVRATTEPLLVFAADDVTPHEGWVDEAENHITAGASVVGLNDLRDRADTAHATHFLVARKYAERPCADGSNGPLHEGYEHNFVDREFVDTARHRGLYVYCAAAVLEHRHHLDGKAEFDDTYARGQAGFKRDARLYRRRARLWRQRAAA